MSVLQAAFWSATILIIYAYWGYPLLLYVLSKVRTRQVRKAAISPTVTLIITAYNEEARIVEKLDNTVKLTYPRDRLEIIVASDCSSDRTDALVKGYASQGVTLIRSPQRKGKEAAQRLAVQASTGEILIFSDVATILPENAIINIVKSFADPTVGCVSSEDRYVSAEGVLSGEGAYVRYEMWLRSLESRVNSLVGLSGSFFAARSSVCKAGWSDDLQSDFNTVLNSMRMNLRGVADPESVGYYKSIKDEKKEFERKVRTVLRGISVFMRSLALINPLRYPLFAWQLISHKLCRWLVPFAMIAAFLCSAVLAWSYPFYRFLFALQVAFYIVAASGLICQPLTKNALIKIPSFFVMVNASILQAWWRYLGGERLVAWEPSRR